MSSYMEGIDVLTNIRRSAPHRSKALRLSAPRKAPRIAVQHKTKTMPGFSASSSGHPWERLAMPIRPGVDTSADVIDNPIKVVVMPHRARTLEFDSVSRVVISAGKRTIPPPSFARGLTEYDNGPDHTLPGVDLTVYNKDGTVQSFQVADAANVYGGTLDQSGTSILAGDLLGVACAEIEEFLGASDPGDTLGPVSPAQLAQLDRALTPAEQKAVDDYQAQQSNAAQAAEEQKGGPKATATVTAHGASVSKSPVSPAPGRAAPAPAGGFLARSAWDGGPKVWQAALGGVGAIGLVVGIGLALRRR